MTINALFAVDKFGGMGLNGSLPWPHCPEDMAYFKKLTTGHVVVMGRNTWDDPKMPKPLVGREVYIATNRFLPNEGNAKVISGDFKEQLLLLEQAHPKQIIWVIGGPTILAQCDGVLDKIYLTHYAKSYKIDSRIDLKSFLSGWQLHTGTASPNTNCSFVTYAPIFNRPPPNPGNRTDKN